MSTTGEAREARLAERPKVRDDVVFRQLDEECVVYDPSAGKMHVLNGTATMIWRYADGEHTVGEIVGLLCDQFDPPAAPDVVERDVVEVTLGFADAGLLQ